MKTSSSVTRWLDYLLNLGIDNNVNLPKSLKLTHQAHNFAKYYLNPPYLKGQRLLIIFLSGEISPNLVTLISSYTFLCSNGSIRVGILVAKFGLGSSNL